jgi:hypothetical protein
VSLGDGSNLVLHQNLLYQKGMCQSTAFSSLFHQMTPTKCFTMSYRDKFVVHHTQAVEKSNQEDLLSDSMNQKFLFPSDILAYHLKD